ncbi:MAG: LysR family transcriptional regulator [Acidobacteriaceae bacterium]|nr:LysR family transcriptional regulator [Acidobacteriaceae bacterium]
MLRSDLADLALFAVIAEERSFTLAARRLGLSQSALSHAMKNLERRLGLNLLARTSRSVAPTAAGVELLQGLMPALQQIESSLSHARKSRSKPSGRIRLIAPRTAVRMVLMPVLASFAAEFPEITVEVTTSNDRIDIVTEGYDAGIQIGEYVQRDMIALPVSEDLQLAVFGTPKYFRAHPEPKTPRELKDHACIGFRFQTGIYRWEFEKGKRAITIHPRGPLEMDDSELVVEAVLKGLGVGTALVRTVRPLLDNGKLVQVLEDWCPVFPGFYFYYPSRRNKSAALTALIKHLREHALS